jgi:hypothetical protein
VKVFDFEREKERLRFDWYAASVQCREDNFIEAFLEAFPGCEMVASRGAKQYQRGVTFKDNDTGESLGELSFGGNQGAVPFFEVRGFHSHEVALFVRRVFPVHRVSRLDVCLDFDQPGLYDRLYPVLSEVAKAHKVKPTSFNDNFPEEGRSLQLGAKSSEVVCTMYEKGKQMASVKGVTDASPDWVRVEFRIRPHSRQKALYAALEPWECLGGAKWGRSVTMALSGCAPSPIVREKPVKRERIEKAAWVIENYWKSLCDCSDEELLELIRAKREAGSRGLRLVTCDVAA